MQGCCKYLANDQSYQELGELIDDDHLLKKVNDCINFDSIERLTEKYYSPNNGRPSFPPRQYFKMMLVKHLFSIKSNRSLVREVRYNVSYRWFCEFNLSDSIPHHASLSNIKKRFTVELFENFFLAILEQCKEQGLISSQSVMTDSTLFQANAAISSMRLKEPKSDNTPNKDKKTTKISNKTHASKTDPDATLAYKAGTARTLKYKAHISSDSGSRIITAIKITTGSVHDSKPYIEQVNYLKGKVKLKISEAIADRAYGSGNIISSLERNGVKTYIPLFSSRSGSSNNSVVPGFTYDTNNDEYICSNNEVLKPYPEDNDYIIYRILGGKCKNCPISESCQGLKKKGRTGRFIRRHLYFDLFIQVNKKMKETKFQEKLNERLWKLEGIMNEIKNYHGLNRAHYRGLDNVQIQGYMAAIAVNIKRLVFCAWIFWCLRIKQHGSLSLSCL